jgi:hypothetical protein
VKKNNALFIKGNKIVKCKSHNPIVTRIGLQCYANNLLFHELLLTFSLFGNLIQPKILKYVVWRGNTYDLDFLKSLHKRDCRKFLTIQIRNVCKLHGSKSLDYLSQSTYMPYKKRVRETIGLYHTITRGHTNNEV